MGNADGNASRPTLLVIDAMSQIFRAFYAVPPHFSITNPAGETEYTNAVYGFVTLLLRVVAQIQPEYIVVAFDLPGPTFRTEEYTDYKANRDAPPDELIPQFDRVRQVVSALGLPRYELAGYEADDILGFMAKAGVADGLRILLVTGDRDVEVRTLIEDVQDSVLSPCSLREHSADQSQVVLDVDAQRRLRLQAERLLVVGDGVSEAFQLHLRIADVVVNCCRLNVVA